MAISVSNWVWDHSRSQHGSRLVLLALADFGESSWPSIAELQRKTRLGERAVHTAIADLTKIGELAVDRNAGPKGCNRYRILMKRGAESAPLQILHPADSAPLQILQGSESVQVNGQTPADSAPPADIAGVQISTPDPAESAPGSVKDPSKNSPTESSTDTAGGDDALFAATGPLKPSRRKAAAAHPVATRIPDDFAVDADMRDWAKRKIPGYDYESETENFIDWWRSKPGAAGTKTDWPATWRTWMRRNAREAGFGNGASSPRSNGRGTPGKQTNYDDEEYSSGWH